MESEGEPYVSTEDVDLLQRVLERYPAAAVEGGEPRHLAEFLDVIKHDKALLRQLSPAMQREIVAGLATPELIKAMDYVAAHIDNSPADAVALNRLAARLRSARAV